MSNSDPSPGERVTNVRVGDHALSVDLADGRTITVPLAWFPRLLHASLDQRAKWQISSGGFGIHWPEIDEDLSSAGLLRGAPAAVRRRGGGRTEGRLPIADPRFRQSRWRAGRNDGATPDRRSQTGAGLRASEVVANARVDGRCGDGVGDAADRLGGAGVLRRRPGGMELARTNAVSVGGADPGGSRSAAAAARTTARSSAAATARGDRRAARGENAEQREETQAQYHRLHVIPFVRAVMTAEYDVCNR
jgi:hypothetical protein